MKWRVEWERQDIDSREGEDIRTLRQLRIMGNTIDSDIKMKEDVPSLNGDGKLPILDTKMWVETGEEGRVPQIRYEL